MTWSWNYRICSIRRRGYYLFHHVILCGFYSRAATNRERRLLNSVSSVKVFRTECKCFEKSQFYKLNKKYRCGDLVLKQTFQLLDQPPLCCTAPPICFFVFFYQWLHMLVALRTSNSLPWPFESWGLFTFARATRILAAANIREWQLFHSAHPEVRRQFESGD